MLAARRAADRLIIDERAGTTAARALGLHAVGTLGVLLIAADRQIIDLPAKLDLLANRTNFRMSAALRDHVLDRWRALRRPSA